MDGAFEKVEHLEPPAPALVPRPRLQGHVDVKDWEQVAGWVWDPDSASEQLTVDIVTDGRVVASVVASDFRADLLKSGIGDGHHGFSLSVHRSLIPSFEPIVVVREQASQAVVAGSPFELPDDGYLAVHASARVVGAFADKAIMSGSTDALQQTAATLLTQFDRIVSHLAEQNAVDDMLASEWRKVCEPRTTRSVVAGLLTIIQDRYGSGALTVNTSQDPDVSIIIPTHNNFAYTFQCLKALSTHPSRLAVEVIVVDDFSTDETLLGSVIVTGVRFIRNSKNIGFLGSIEAGVRESRGKYICLLNNDTNVHAGWLDELVATLLNLTNVGVVGSKLLATDGSLQECGGIIWANGEGWNYGKGEDPGRPEYCHLRDCDYVSGASLLLRRSTWDSVGGFSSEFAPGYYEDADLCFKVRAAGKRVVVQPASVVTHHEGVSAGTNVGGRGMKRFQQANQHKFLFKWWQLLISHGESSIAAAHNASSRLVLRHALIIDDTIPTPEQDAGSVAIVSHAESLIRLGYQVHYCPSHNMSRIDPYTRALERVGILCYSAPYYTSAEDVIRAFPGRFQIVYLNRLTNASYLPLIRRYSPASTVLYNVCDLHHLRLEREAKFRSDVALSTKAAIVKKEELSAIKEADLTIVMSSAERKYLTKAAAKAKVALIPWSVRPKPISAPFAMRQGVAFVGSMHPPNIDGIKWYLSEVHPLVLKECPLLPLYLIGNHTADPEVMTLVDTLNLTGLRTVQPLGVIADLDGTLKDVRLTIAPLRYGAGLKGKVLESLARGLPCVMTSIAAEGTQLTVSLNQLVAIDAETFARLVIRAHSDEDFNRGLSQEALTYVEDTLSERAIDDLLGHAISEAIVRTKRSLSAGYEEPLYDVDL